MQQPGQRGWPHASGRWAGSSAGRTSTQPGIAAFLVRTDLGLGLAPAGSDLLGGLRDNAVEVAAESWPALLVVLQARSHEDTQLVEPDGRHRHRAGQERHLDPDEHAGDQQAAPGVDVALAPVQWAGCITGRG